MAKPYCMQQLKSWADRHGGKVHSMVSVSAKAEHKEAPYSELCMWVKCAGKRIRAFAVSKNRLSAGIVFMDKGKCSFTDGLRNEVLPLDLDAKVAALGGARRRRRRR
jgi:hypothetical protein